MTEAEWLACTDPWPMLEFLRGKRKLRLYASGCCRRLFPLIPDSPACGVVEAAERFADGQIGRRRLRAIWNESTKAGERHAGPDRHARLALVNLMLNYCLTHRPRRTGMDAVASAVVEASCNWWSLWRRRKTRTAERMAQCHLLRDIIGNPFRPASMDPSWLTPKVVQLAQTIYDERAFDGLPILANALEEAGCDTREILNHCRQPGEHVRGCWAVDLILEKE